MKKLIMLLSVFSILFILLTFLQNKLEVIDAKIENLHYENNKLEHELNFIKTEWEYINSPANIALLTENYFDHRPAELINIEDFIKFILITEEVK